MFKAIFKKKQQDNESWPYRCRAHNRPTGMRCSRCETEPLCINCARRNHGLGYICRRCEAELLARSRARRQQLRATGIAK